MKHNRLAHCLALAGLIAAHGASAAIVGNINFGTLGDAPTLQHLETTTFANTWVNAGDPAGTTITGYGVVSTVAGSSNYCAVGNCTLYFVNTAELAATATAASIMLTNSTYTFYIDYNVPRNLLNFSSANNMAFFIPGLTEWAYFTGHAPGQIGLPLPVDYALTGALTGSSFTGTGSGLADVVLGLGLPGVAAFFNANSFADGRGGFADVAITSSVNTDVRNPNDTCTFITGQWCSQGTTNVRGSTVAVPEPGSLALLGLGMAGVAAVRRKRAGASV